MSISLHRLRGVRCLYKYTKYFMTPRKKPIGERNMTAELTASHGLIEWQGERVTDKLHHLFTDCVASRYDCKCGHQKSSPLSLERRHESLRLYHILHLKQRIRMHCQETPCIIPWSPRCYEPSLPSDINSFSGGAYGRFAALWARAAQIKSQTTIHQALGS